LHRGLPLGPHRTQASARFGDVAIRELITRIAAVGCDQRHLQAKIFGGACVLDAFQYRRTHLGAQNSDFAKRILRQEGIPLVGEDIGGRKGRKLIFHTHDGTVWVKQL
jgi:chemotaxis protein CheD